MSKIHSLPAEREECFLLTSPFIEPVKLIPTPRYETFRTGGRRMKFIVKMFQAKFFWKR
jgi:hypothetical protein